MSDRHVNNTSNPDIAYSRLVDMATRNGGDDCSEVLLTGQSRPQRDRFHLVYFILLLLGIGSLLPWNFFITAHEYFSTKLKDTRYQHDFENYFALAAFGPNLVTFFLNALFKHKVALKLRILLPLFVIAVLFIVTAVFVWINTDEWKGGFFAITLATIALINVFCAVFQGGLFGLAGMMPAKYTQAVMAGQGVGGIFACVADICSKLGTSDPLDSAFWYFATAVVVVVMCFAAYLALYKIQFSQYYLAGHKEEVDIVGPTTVQPDEYEYSDTPRLTKEKPDMNVRMKKATPPFGLVVRQIWRFALPVFLVFMVTLSVFPSVISGVKSKHKDDGSLWTGKFFTPVVCFLVFNVGDFCGRLMAGIIQKPGKNGYWLLLICISRVVFIPLFAFCNYQPRKGSSSVLFEEDYWPILFNIFFALSNGYLGSLCMMYGPSVVDSKYAETAGTIMAFFLALGLSSGATLTFGITKAI